MRAALNIIIISLLGGCVTPVEYRYEGEREASFMAQALGEVKDYPTIDILQLNDEIRASLDEELGDAGFHTVRELLVPGSSSIFLECATNEH